MNIHYINNIIGNTKTNSIFIATFYELRD